MTAETLKNLPGDIRKLVFECAPLERPSDRTPPTAFFYSDSKKSLNDHPTLETELKSGFGEDDGVIAKLNATRASEGHVACVCAL